MEIQNIQEKTISDLAAHAENNWKITSKNGIHFAARPYLSAMFSLSSINDSYGMDSAREIVIRFLCNAGSWRGEIAKQVKAELNRRVKTN